MNLLNLSAVEIAKQIASQNISICDVLKFYLDRIEQFKELNCISALYSEEALDRAKALDQQLTQVDKLPPFFGVPVLVKDNLFIQGKPTSAGTIYFDDIAEHSSRYVELLENLGFIIIGKTCMTELAFGLSGLNPKQGTPKNPWSELTIAPGGSSSGSAVAVAAGLVPMAIGGDTGGSIRTPAALNGIFGFKPSAKLIQDNGSVPLSKTLDTLGVFSLHVEDIKQFYLHAADLSQNPVAEKIYYIADEDLPFPLDSDISQAWNEFKDKLCLQGFDLEAWSVPDSIDFQNLSDRTSDIIAYESYRYHGDVAHDHSKQMWDKVRGRVLRGHDIDTSAYEKLMNERHIIQDSFKDSLRGQCLIFPVTPFSSAISTLDDTEFMHVGEYTRPFNYLDAPSISLPVAYNDANIPMGFQLIAAKGQDDLVLNTAEIIKTKLELTPVISPLCK